ncbi:MAG TPA: hypothetical protein VFR81_20790, partial [Longimicrobium sp.]|nr:hypothetical protein [Longimicrobium sp.]
MPKPEITEFTEFTYAYSITDNMMNGALPCAVGIPLFPSLQQEGKLSGGYDVEIPRSSFPVFLQYKIPQVMVKRSRKTPDAFTAPYYRMHLRAPKISTQHESLLTHELGGRAVYYVVPHFHTAHELRSRYTHKKIPEGSAFIRPS